MERDDNKDSNTEFSGVELGRELESAQSETDIVPSDSSSQTSESFKVAIEPHSEQSAAHTEVIETGHEKSAAEQRRNVERAIGPALDSAFTRNAEHVVKNPKTGMEELTLYVRPHDNDKPILRREEQATIRLSQRRDSAGNRTAYMSFTDYGWDNHWRFTDGPNQTPRLDQGEFDKDGNFTAFTPETPAHPNGDEEVVRLGKYWLNQNLIGSPTPLLDPAVKERAKRTARRFGQWLNRYQG